MKRTLALIQTTCSADPVANLSRLTKKITEAAESGGEIICLQELHNSLYFCQEEATHHFDLAEPIPGPTTERLSSLAAHHRVVIVSSLFERRDAGLYHNTSAVFDTDGRMAGLYRKMHIPDDPGFYEKFYFTPGDIGFQPITTAYGKLGVLVCWDQWYPEAARLMALQGAHILIYPTAIGWDPADSPEEKSRQREAWITIMRSHAIANGCFVAAINRTGHETWEGVKGIDFWGNSFVADPQGSILAHAGLEETTLLVQCDMGRVESVRRLWPFFRDRRIDAFQDLSKRYIDECPS